MGTRGPIPKRSTERVRQNKTAPVTSLPGVQTDAALQVLDFVEDPHFLTVGWWDAAQKSAMREFWQPTDWMQLRTALWFLDKQYKASRQSSMMVDSCYKMLADLGVSEGPRRRMRFEAEPSGGKQEADVHDYAAALKAKWGVG